jgi:phosphatidylinositol glycan class Q protein
MFESYFELGNRIRKQYFSPGVILKLATGRFVPPLPRSSLYSLQYSMLPAKRPGIAELWNQVRERNKDEVGARLRGGNGYPLPSVRRAYSMVG